MRPALRISTFFVLLAAAGCAASPAQAPPTDSSLIAALEDSLWATSRDDRAQPFAGILAPTYRGVYADGFHDKAKEIVNLTEVTIESYRLKDLQVRPLAPDIYAVTYRATVTGTYQDYTLDGEYWCSTVWQRAGGRWQAVLHTETKAP